MSILELLKRLRGREKQVADLKEKISLRRDAATNITARYGERVPGGSGGDGMPAYAAQIDDLSRKITEVTQLWQAEMSYCVALCDKYDGVERTLLYNFYGKGWTLRAIAMSGGYSEGYCRKAKAKLDESLKNAEVEKHLLPDWYIRRMSRHGE